ncbi:AI-2E family transporter [soil metagenome]
MTAGDREAPGVAGDPTPPGIVERLATELGARMYRAVGLIFLFAIIFRYFDAIMHVILIAFVGVILGIAFNAAIVRIPLSRGLSTILLALATLAVLAATVWFGISVLSQQIRSLAQDMPSILASLEEWELWLQDRIGIDVELLGDRGQQLIGDAMGGVSGGALLSGAFGALEVLAVSLLVLVGAFFLVAKPNEQLLNPLMRAVPQHRRPAVERMFSRTGERLGGWLWGTLLSMLIIGALSSVAFYFIGAPYPILLGVIVGLFDIIPLVGPWIGGLIAVFVTLVHDPSVAIWVALTVLIVQEVEGNLIRPVVMSESAKLHPFVTLLALLLFASMFGLLGAILSLPLVLVIGTIVEVFWVEETLKAGNDPIEPLVEI